MGPSELDKTNWTQSYAHLEKNTKTSCPLQVEVERGSEGEGKWDRDSSQDCPFKWRWASSLPCLALWFLFS